MPLKLSVVESHLPARRQTFVIRSSSSETLSWETFANIMAERCVSLGKAGVLAAMELLKEELLRQLCEGKAVKTPIGSFQVSASGSLGSPAETFHPADPKNKHELRIRYRPEPRFAAEARRSTRFVRSYESESRKPEISCVLADGQDSAEAGDILKLRGLNLTFDRSNLKEGLFFIDSSGTETRVKAYAQIRPTSLLALIPSGLRPGSYTLALRSLGGGKTLREGRLEGFGVKKE